MTLWKNLKKNRITGRSSNYKHFSIFNSQFKKKAALTLIVAKKNISLATFRGRGIKGEGISKKAAFTLAETLIALTVLGIIAVLTVPNLIRKQVEAQNRTKLKKAMSIFDVAIAKMTVENDIKTMTRLKSWADENGACANSRTYFKVVTNTGDGACKFRTSDGIWWDITEIDRPIVAFKEANLTSEKAQAENDYDAFTLVASFDESNGVFRVDDNGFEKKRVKEKISNAPEETLDDVKEKAAALEKIFGFINLNSSKEETIQNPFASCSEFPCEVNGLSWKGKIQISQAEADAAKITDSYMCSWNPETGECPLTGGSEVKAIDEDLFVSEPLTLTADEAKSEENCATSIDPSYCAIYGNYWNLARRKCEAAGGRLPTGAELKAMYNKGGQLDSSSFYWASEATSNSTAFAYMLYTYNGNVTDRRVNYLDLKALCVGN